MDGPVNGACMKCGKPGKMYYKYTTAHIVLCHECASVNGWTTPNNENGTMKEQGISKPLLLEPYSPDSE